MESAREKGAWVGWGCAALAAGLAASQIGTGAGASHDAGVARALGLEAQPFGALDPVLASLFAWAAMGTLSARAAMGQALALGVAAVVLFVLARNLLSRCADTPRIGPVVAGIAASCATLGSVWQLEGAAPVGSVPGALLALIPMTLLVRAGERSGVRLELAFFVTGLAFAQDPQGGLPGAVGSAVLVAATPALRQSIAGAWKEKGPTLVAWLGAGLLPGALALSRVRHSGGSVASAMVEAVAAERGASVAGAPWAFVQNEVGLVMLALAACGAAIAALVGPARPLSAALCAIALAGLSCGWLGSALGPERFGAPMLEAVAATSLLAGVSMQALVRAVARAKVPMARGSAAMIVVLELVAPVEAADEALQHGEQRANDPASAREDPVSAWDDIVWGALPPRSVVLVTDVRVFRRAQAARAIGSLRGDLTVVPVFAHGSRAGPFVARDPELMPLWRDFALAGAPTEATLSALATERPVFTSFEPTWSKAMGKHLVPAGLFDRFEPEPRGTSDRRGAFDSLAPERERLRDVVARDPDLLEVTAFLLHQRVLGLSSIGENDLVEGALRDWTVFANDAGARR